jgi:hypothetical protein
LTLTLPLARSPTRLSRPQDAEGAAEQDALLQRWARLHWVRTGLSATSFAVMVATLVSKRSSSR